MLIRSRSLFHTRRPPLAAFTGSEPSYNPATDKLIHQDGFDSYTGILTGSPSFVSKYPTYRSLDLNDATIALDQTVSLVTGRGGTGNAVRIKYGNPTPGSGAFTTGTSDTIIGTEGRWGSIGSWNGTLPEVAGPYAHFLQTLWIRFSAGADPAASNDSGVKGIMHWYGSSRYQHAPHKLLDYNGNRYPETRWDAGPPRPPNSVTGLDQWKTASGDAPKFSAYNDGNFHRFTSEYFGTGSGHVGMRWWLDGVLMIDCVDNVGDNHWGADYVYGGQIDHVMFFGNYVTGAAAYASPAFTVDFDDWTAWTN